MSLRRAFRRPYVLYLECVVDTRICLVLYGCSGQKPALRAFQVVALGTRVHFAARGNTGLGAGVAALLAGVTERSRSGDGVWIEVTTKLQGKDVLQRKTWSQF